MNELIEDGGTTEVTTKSTSTISIISIQFHLQNTKGSSNFFHN